MSVVFSIKETLNIKNEHNYELIVGALRYQYTLLGALMLNDDAKIFDMTLIADGKTYTFQGDAVTPEFKAFLDQLRSAREISLTAEYEYWMRTSYTDLGIGPSEICELIKELLEEDAIEINEFFYATHHTVDCEESFGILTAYGERNGKQYHGTVELEPVECFPEDGKWISMAWPIINFCAGNPSEENINKIRELCKKFDENAKYTLDVSEDMIEFEMGQTGRLQSKEDFERLGTLCTELYKIPEYKTDEEYFSFDGQFLDIESDVPRLMEFDFDADGKYTMKVASV